MGAPSKRARKIRSSSEFDVARLSAALRPPTSNSGAYAWDLAAIRSARDAQMVGRFALAARLAESTRTDDAIFVARENRLAPSRCIKVEMRPAPNARGAAVSREGEGLFGQDGVGVTPEAVTDINGFLADHGIAFATLTWTPRADGSRVDVEMHPFPIEFVRWDATRRCFMARVEPGSGGEGEADAGEVPIVHGDGRWVVFAKNEIEPFKHGALLAAALVWARHAFAIRDWAKSSVAHGNTKVIGALPEGVPLQSAEGGLTAEAEAFVALLRDYATSDAPTGIKPFGAEVTFVTNTATAWQVFNELVQNAEKAAARIYLGTDGTLGAQGGAPGVDIQALFGVAATIVEGDLRCIERGILTGVIEPWCAVNFGDSTLAPRRRYLLPDADADAARASLETRKAAFFADVAAARENGFAITQEYVDALAKEHGITSPKLAPPPVTDIPKTAPAAAQAPPALRVVPPLHEALSKREVGDVVRGAVAEALSHERRATERIELHAPISEDDVRAVVQKALSALPGAPTPQEPSSIELAEHAARMTAAFLADIREARLAGVRLTQQWVDDTARRYGVPTLQLEAA